MPSIIDLSDLANRYDVQNQAQFSKYSVYFVRNAIKYIHQWQVFGKLYGNKDWKPNMGDTMQGVRIEPTPKVRTFFRPNAVTARANKDVFDQRESQERATVRWHKFESKLIYFLRNWQDFIDDQIKPAMADINEQVVYANEVFLRTLFWDRSPNVYICGSGDDTGIVAAPHSGPAGYTANPKSDAWVADKLANVTQSLTPEILENVFLAAREDLAVIPFSGSPTPKDNDPIAGNYVFVGSLEAFVQMKHTPGFANLRSQDKDYLHSRFRGPFFDNLVWRCEDKPIRFTAAGASHEPEVIDEITGESIPNPNYTSLTTSPFELGWFLGGEAYNALKIGPPPKEFNGGASANKVKGMNWNGKVYLTDDVLIKDSNNVYDTNSYGEYLRAQGTLTMGALPARPRNAIPVIYRRRRVSEAA
jgi:hypothetical protein